MRAWWMLGLAGLVGCNDLGLVCTEMGCGGQLTIFVEGELPEGAAVEVRGAEGIEEVSCVVGDEVAGCPIEEIDGRAALVVYTGMSDLGDTVVVSIDDGESLADYELAPAWGEPWYPNGEACGPSCRSGEAELVLE